MNNLKPNHSDKVFANNATQMNPLQPLQDHIPTDVGKNVVDIISPSENPVSG